MAAASAAAAGSARERSPSADSTIRATESKKAEPKKRATAPRAAALTRPTEGPRVQDRPLRQARASRAEDRAPRRRAATARDAQAAEPARTVRRVARGTGQATADARTGAEPATRSARPVSRAAAASLGAATLTAAAVSAPAPRLDPEARLIAIYRLIGHEELDQALAQAASLSRDHPNFPLAQLVYGDLLMARSGSLRSFGAAPLAQLPANAERLQQLRDEARRRLAALRERPPAGAIPRQFVMLPPSSRHAIAVDASRSRVYLFENGDAGLRLVADYYASLGKLGIDKRVEGDQRTPLGVYFITSRLDPRQLSDFYGSGALPLNYPNEYDRRLGRTGSGIWLHGVPGDSYARSPNSTDGCVALANPDLADILGRVQPRSTPVLIAPRLEWVQPRALDAERERVRNLLEGWRIARSSGDLQRALSFYSSQFVAGSLTRAQLPQGLEREIATLRGRTTRIKDLSVLAWRDRSDIMVVTFGEVLEGQRSGPIKRQYWGKEGGLWKIFYEGVIG
ncbi:MAG: L,D-transpeptidase family protein [Pseudomonadota bacterium]